MKAFNASTRFKIRHSRGFDPRDRKSPGMPMFQHPSPDQSRRTKCQRHSNFCDNPSTDCGSIGIIATVKYDGASPLSGCIRCKSFTGTLYWWRNFAVAVLLRLLRQFKLVGVCIGVLMILCSKLWIFHSSRLGFDSKNELLSRFV